MFEICFQYDEVLGKWEVIAKGATTPLEAVQGFNAVLLTASEATPSIETNKAELLTDGSYKIHVGV